MLSCLHLPARRKIRAVSGQSPASAHETIALTFHVATGGALLSGRSNWLCSKVLRSALCRRLQKQPWRARYRVSENRTRRISTVKAPPGHPCIGRSVRPWTYSLRVPRKVRGPELAGHSWFGCGPRSAHLEILVAWATSCLREEAEGAIESSLPASACSQSATKIQTCRLQHTVRSSAASNKPRAAASAESRIENQELVCPLQPS